MYGNKKDYIYSVYCHYFPNGKVYVGITSKEPEKRWLKDGYGYKHQKVIYSAIKKYGWDNIEHVVIAKNINLESAKNIEINLIELYDSTNRKNGYNISPGGNLISEESRGKISKTHTGFRHSEESRKKMSIERKGKKKTEEHKRKIGEAHKGMKMSEEFCRKMSEIAKNRHYDTTNDPRNIPVLQYNIFDGSFVARYRSFSEAARITGASVSHINDCAKGKRRQEINCIWIYENMATEEYIQRRLESAKLHSLYKPVVLSRSKDFSNPIYCESTAMAAEFINSNISTFRCAIRMGDTCRGYYIKRVSAKEYITVMYN